MLKKTKYTPKLSMDHYNVLRGVESAAGHLKDSNYELPFPIYVTGSGKRDIFAHTVIFQYKCCSKTPNTFYKFVFGLAVSTTLATLTPNLRN